MERDGSMDEKEFCEEIRRIRENMEDFYKPYSPCEYFHGREKFFTEEQLQRAVRFFLDHQQKRLERKKEDGF
jgi:hypothetical protein